MFFAPANCLKTQQLIGVMFANTQGIYNWHQQMRLAPYRTPATNVGRWQPQVRRHGIFSNDPLLGRCGFPPTFYHVINKTIWILQINQGSWAFTLFLWMIFRGFASYFGMMVWLVFQRLVTWYVNIMMYNGKMKTKLGYQKKSGHVENWW